MISVRGNDGEDQNPKHLLSAFLNLLQLLNYSTLYQNGFIISWRTLCAIPSPDLRYKKRCYKDQRLKTMLTVHQEN